MYKADEGSRYGELTVEQARSLRAEQAKMAALYTDRVEQARAAARYGAMSRWIDSYRRATTRCRFWENGFAGCVSIHPRLPRSSGSLHRPLQISPHPGR